jgi:squalene-hopene/tetraprenyl-beta-curcumene cyclase
VKQKAMNNQLVGMLSAVLFTAATAALVPEAGARTPLPRDWADEPLLPQLSVARAAEFLDKYAQNCEGKCVTCHGTFPYLLARPALAVPSAKHADVRSRLEKWVAQATVAGLNKKAGAIEISEAVMAGAVLAQHDAATTGKLQPATRHALDLMWRLQQPDGGFNWTANPTEAPSAIDQHFGPTMVAVGVGAAPDSYAETPEARTGLEKLRAYLSAHPPETIHQHAMLLLADHGIGALLTEEARRQTVTNLLALQRPDGGWAMASLGNATWKRKDGKPQDLTTSDGYGTGFCVYVLRVAGQVPADDARLRQAVPWLKTHQRTGGYWYTRSPRNSDELSTLVGTAYVVLALKSCGEF